MGKRYSQQQKCDFVEKNNWRHEKEFDYQYIPSEKYKLFFCLIRAQNYKFCRNKLKQEKKYLVKFYEVYGKHDFIAKIFFKKTGYRQQLNAFQESISGMNPPIVLPEDFECYEVVEEYIYNFEEKKIEKKTHTEHQELPIQKLNMFNVFILLKRKSDGMKPSDLLTEIERLESDHLQNFIYRIYILRQIPSNSEYLLLYMNVDCKKINKLNPFSTLIDFIVDGNGYTKTSLISTTRVIKKDVIMKIRKPNIIENRKNVKSTLGIGSDKPSDVTMDDVPNIDPPFFM